MTGFCGTKNIQIQYFCFVLFIIYNYTEYNQQWNVILIKNSFFLFYVVCLNLSGFCVYDIILLAKKKTVIKWMHNTLTI